jgi:hypothetical protein
MRRTVTWIIGALLTAALAACYNPALPAEPFLCGAGKKCPDGYACYGGICRDSAPACLTRSEQKYFDWPVDNQGRPATDEDLEPNNHEDLATTLPCGSDPRTDPTYGTRCPTRENYTNGLMNLTVCPKKDYDFYKIYLFANETITFEIVFMHTVDPPRNLDAQVKTWDFAQQKFVQVGLGQSTNNNERINLSINPAEGKLEGWYYLVVYGATPEDENFYTVSFTLNPP